LTFIGNILQWGGGSMYHDGFQQTINLRK